MLACLFFIILSVNFKLDHARKVKLDRPNAAIREGTAFQMDHVRGIKLDRPYVAIHDLHDDGAHSLHVEIHRSIASCLHSHNVVRTLHGVSLLEWDEDLAYGAEEWALYLAATHTFVHSNLNGYGENLYQLTGPQATCAKAVHAWYSEIRMYNFDKPGFSYDTGHFTQLVWRSTTKVGVAIVFVPDEKTSYVVARYSSRGNSEGSLFGAEVPHSSPGVGIPSILELELSPAPISIDSEITVKVTDHRPCNDIDSRCSEFAQLGHCVNTEYEEWMHQSCAKSCAFCEMGPPTDGEWTEWMSVSSCSKTCLRDEERLCANPFPSENGHECVGPKQRKSACTADGCTTGPSSCEDITNSASCEVYKEKGYCDGGTYQPWMHVNCAKTCSKCAVESELNSNFN